MFWGESKARANLREGGPASLNVVVSRHKSWSEASSDLARLQPFRGEIVKPRTEVRGRDVMSCRGL